MKKILLVLLFSLVGSSIIINPYGSLNVFSQTISMEKSPKGSGGLEWEDSVAVFLEKYPKCLGFKTSIQVLQDNVKYANCLDPPQLFGGVRIYEITWYFGFDKFYNADIEFLSQDVPILLEVLKAKYGNPEKQNPLVLMKNPNAEVGMSYMWSSKTVAIFLGYNDVEGKGYLEYIYLPIREKIKNKQKEGLQKMQDSL